MTSMPAPDVDTTELWAELVGVGLLGTERRPVPSSVSDVVPTLLDGAVEGETTSGAARYYPGGDARHSPYPAPARAGYDPPAPVVTHSTSYLAAPRPVQTTSRYDRPAR